MAEALPASNWSKPLQALALEWFYMSFHKNNCNKFATAGRKLDTKTFELITKFFEIQFTTTKNDSMLERMELEHIKNMLNSSSRASFTTRFALVRTNILPTGQT
jgi:hypothetical protein